jgi:hypothetical protein
MTLSKSICQAALAFKSATHRMFASKEDPIRIISIKWHVLPLFVVMFIVNYIGRVNIGFVRQHLSADLGIEAAPYGLGAGLVKESILSTLLVPHRLRRTSVPGIS